MSRAADLRRKKARNAIKAGDVQQEVVNGPPVAVVASKAAVSTRPTDERRRHGKWILPRDAGKREQPMVDVANDMIGRLYHEGKLTAGQEQAARAFDELWASFEVELGVSGFKSCLAGGVGSHDDSDGNPAVNAAWDSLGKRIGRVSVAALKLEVRKGAEGKPYDLRTLQWALDKVAGGG